MGRLTVHIPQPCHERWTDMQPQERGRFCASCQKVVTDYTTCSDQELVRRLSQSSHSGCGRFRDDQLNRPLAAFDAEGTPIWRHWLSLLTFGLLSWQTARAQVSLSTPSAPTTTVRPDSLPVFQPIKRNSETDEGQKWLIEGRVMFKDTNGNITPLSGADVTVGQQLRGVITRTDQDGAFQVKIPTKNQDGQLHIRVFTKDKNSSPFGMTFDAQTATTSIKLDDIILHPIAPLPVITGGGLVIVKTSRWQILKQRLFRKHVRV